MLFLTKRIKVLVVWKTIKISQLCIEVNSLQVSIRGRVMNNINHVLKM